MHLVELSTEREILALNVEDKAAKFGGKVLFLDVVRGEIGKVKSVEVREGEGGIREKKN